MKYLCVIPSYYPAFKFGGSVTAIHALNAAMARAGAEVTVYTTDVGLYGQVESDKESIVDGVKVTYFSYFPGLDFLGQTGWHFSPSMTSALIKNVKNYDILYLPAIWNYPTLAAAICCRLFKKPYVIAPHGSLYPFTFSRKSWKKLPYYWLIAKKIIWGAAAVHFTTEDEKEKTSANLGFSGRTILVPNGQSADEFSKLPKANKLCQKYPELKDKKVIFFLGRIDWIKGLDLLAKSFALVLRKRPDAHLLIVGPDENGYEQKIRDLLKKERALKAATFTGNLTGNERLEAFSVSYMFVLPSHSENFSMAAIEAMAAGIPVIVSDNVGINREISRNRAGLVVKCEPAQIAENMIKLLENTQLVEELTANAKTMVREYYDIDRVAQLMISELQKTMNKAGKSQ